jgi:hypothetical protein
MSLGLKYHFITGILAFKLNPFKIISIRNYIQVTLSFTTYTSDNKVLVVVFFSFVRNLMPTCSVFSSSMIAESQNVLTQHCVNETT